MIVEEHFAGYRTIGKRPYQQDTYAFCPEDDDNLVLALADGAGGHQSGEVASEAATHSFLDSYFSNPATPEHERMASALDAANLAVGNEAHRLEQDLGTTLICLHCKRTDHGGELRWVSVGDSPLFLFRPTEKRLKRLNADHSMRELLKKEVAEGRISAVEAAKDPNRNTLLSALSGEPLQLIDNPEPPLNLDPEDIVLAASDGIHTLDDTEIFQLINDKREAPARTIAKRLIAAVVEKNNPTQDNTTAAIVKIPGGNSA